MDDELKKYGAGIALCAFLVIFAGSTFKIWEVEMSVESDDIDYKYETKYTFDIDEIVVELSDSDGDDMDSDVKYDDSDCDCSDLESFFGNLKILFYGLLISGCAMAYIGHTGEKTEYAEKAIGAAALFSTIIVVYTFMSLPGAFEEDFENGLSDMDMPGLYGSEDDTNNGVKTEINAKPSLGYVAGIIALGLSGYLIRERGITLQDITG